MCISSTDPELSPGRFRADATALKRVRVCRPKALFKELPPSAYLPKSRTRFCFCEGAPALLQESGFQ